MCMCAKTTRQHVSKEFVPDFLLLKVRTRNIAAKSESDVTLEQEENQMDLYCRHLNAIEECQALLVLRVLYEIRQAAVPTPRACSCQQPFPAVSWQRSSTLEFQLVLKFSSSLED